MRTRVTVTLGQHSQSFVVDQGRYECYEKFRSAFADDHKLWAMYDEDGDLFVFIMDEIKMIVCEDLSNA